MSEAIRADTAAAPSTNWRALHAFGWPAGSVRALLALMVFGTIWAVLVLRPEQEVPEYLRDLMFIVMGHYFAARRQMDAADEPGPPPLFLPRGSVRLILVLGFVVSAVLLYRAGHLTHLQTRPGVITLLLAAGFLAGVVLRSIGGWLSRGGRTPRVLEDLRAMISLLAAVVLAALVCDRYFPFLPQGVHDVRIGLGKIGPPQILSAVVGFYFGSRS